MDIRSNGCNKIITLLILSIVLTVIASVLRCIAESVFNAIMRKKLCLVSLPPVMICVDASAVTASLWLCSQFISA